MLIITSNLANNVSAVSSQPPLLPKFSRGISVLPIISSNQRSILIYRTTKSWSQIARNYVAAFWQMYGAQTLTIIMVIYTGNLLDEQPRPTYSALVGTVNSGPRGRGAVYKKALASKLRNGTVGRNGPTDDFKVGVMSSNNCYHASTIWCVILTLIIRIKFCTGILKYPISRILGFPGV